jgi:hypothetical protein
MVALELEKEQAIEWLAKKFKGLDAFLERFYYRVGRDSDLFGYAQTFNRIIVTPPFPTKAGKVRVVFHLGVWTVKEAEDLSWLTLKGDEQALLVRTVGRVVMSWCGTYIPAGVHYTSQFLKKIADLDNLELLRVVGNLLDHAKVFFAELDLELKRAKNGGINLKDEMVVEDYLSKGGA